MAIWITYVYTWQAYADSIAAHHRWHPFSYLNNSYHRDADMDNMIDCATTLLLSPGVAQIFYGDESGRELSDARLNVDSDQAFRSDMNWNKINGKQLAHFQKLGNIRRSNPVIGAGRQRTLDVHTCIRYNDQDTVLIKLKPYDGEAITTKGIFRDGTQVIELYTGQISKVNKGMVSFPKYENNLAIIKEL